MKHEREALSAFETLATSVSENRVARDPGPTPNPQPPTPGWDPLRAWRLSAVHTPVARGIAAVAAAHPAQGQAFRALVVGGVGGAIAAVLDGNAWGSGSIALEVRSAGELDEVHGLPDGAFDCVAVVDLLPRVAPSRRESVVRELCRLARSGVVISCPFDEPATVAAIRAVNNLYRAAKGADHPDLGRAVELGLPDLDGVRGWLAAAFPHVVDSPTESADAWRLAESLAVAGRESHHADSAADVAAAAFFPNLETAGPDEAPFRTLVVASTRPVAPPPAGARPDRETALVSYLALRASAQQREFERLVESFTAGRDRERAEFREAVASLAAELREREAAAESLARQVRKLEHEAADLRASLAEAETRAYDIGVQDAKSQVHIKNLDAIIADREASLAEASQRIAEISQRVADAESRARTAEEGRALAEHLYQQFVSGRAGRAAMWYIELKRRLLGKK